MGLILHQPIEHVVAVAVYLIRQLIGLSRVRKVVSYDIQLRSHVLVSHRSQKRTLKVNKNIALNSLPFKCILSTTCG